MHINRLTFSGVFFHLTVFGFKNEKNQHFEENKGFGALFIKFNYRWLQTGLADLKKHQTLEIVLMTDFLRFFKTLHIPRFLKIIRNTC